MRVPTISLQSRDKLISRELKVFSFVTTTPNKLVAAINHKRMPVILTKKEEFKTWLTGTSLDETKDCKCENNVFSC